MQKIRQIYKAACLQPQDQEFSVRKACYHFRGIIILLYLFSLAQDRPTFIGVVPYQLLNSVQLEC